MELEAKFRLIRALMKHERIDEEWADYFNLKSQAISILLKLRHIRQKAAEEKLEEYRQSQLDE